MTNEPILIQKIKKSNSGHRFKIRTQTTREGRYSLYFDICINNRRRYTFLQKTVSANPKDKINDENILLEVEELRRKYESELFQNNFDLPPTKSREPKLFIEFCNVFSQTINTRENYKRVIRYIKMLDKKITIQEIKLDYCQELLNLLKKKVKGHNTICGYMVAFKAILNRAVREGYINKNPASDIKLKTVDTIREYLTEEEIKLVMRINTKFKDTRNAFLFSCFTGLRYSDVKKLKFSNIKDNRLTLIQQKTKSSNYIPLSNDALKIIESQREVKSQMKRKHDYVFEIPDQQGTIYQIQKILEILGIKTEGRKFGFHSARHTFATMALKNDMDIFTVSKILGHKDLTTTQIYLHLIDNRKDEQIQKLPKFL